jgi:hypothetical protein
MKILKLESKVTESQLRDRMETDIVVKAIELSRLMRKCQNPIHIKWPAVPRSRLRLESSEKGALICHLLVVPELATTSTGLPQAAGKELILVQCKKITIENFAEGAEVICRESAGSDVLQP